MGNQPNQQQGSTVGIAEPSASEVKETDDEPQNICEDRDSATIYVEPEQSEDIEITSTRLKKQSKREDVTLEKNKHFYRGISEVVFGEHQEETKERIRNSQSKTPISESLIHGVSNPYQVTTSLSTR